MDHPRRSDRAALRVAALKGKVEESWAHLAYPRVHELPFDTRRKRMSTIHLWKDKGGRMEDERTTASPGTLSFPEVAFVKGAPKEVLQLCTHILICGQARPWTTRPALRFWLPTTSMRAARCVCSRWPGAIYPLLARRKLEKCSNAIRRKTSNVP